MAEKAAMSTTLPWKFYLFSSFAAGRRKA